MSVRIRPARATDALALARLRVSTQRSAYRGVLPDAHLDGLRVRRDAVSMLRMLRAGRATTLVAVDGRAVVGYLAVGPALAADEAGWGELWIGSIRSGHRRSGVGRQLWSACIARLDETYETTVGWVIESDTRSRAFHRSLGYAEDGATRVKEHRVRPGSDETFALASVRMVRVRPAPTPPS